MSTMIAGFGQRASMPAMIATTSSSVGAGDIVLTGICSTALESDMASTIGGSATGDLVLDRPRRTGRPGDHGSGDVVVESASL